MVTYDVLQQMFGGLSGRAVSIRAEIRGTFYVQLSVCSLVVGTRS